MAGGRVIRELREAQHKFHCMFHMNLYEYWIYYDFQPLLFDMIFHNNLPPPHSLTRRRASVDGGKISLNYSQFNMLRAANIR